MPRCLGGKPYCVCSNELSGREISCGAVGAPLLRDEIYDIDLSHRRVKMYLVTMKCAFRQNSSTPCRRFAWHSKKACLALPLRLASIKKTLHDMHFLSPPPPPRNISFDSQRPLSYILLNFRRRSLELPCRHLSKASEQTKAAACLPSSSTKRSN